MTQMSAGQVTDISASAQRIKERRRAVGTRETVLVRHGRERHAPMLPHRAEADKPHHAVTRQEWFPRPRG